MVSHQIPDGTSVRMGGRQLVFGEHMTKLEDANDVLGDSAGLRRRLQEEAFLLVRGFHDVDLVLGARAELLREIERQGGIAPGTNLDDAIIADNNGYLPDGNRIGVADDVFRGMTSLLELTTGEHMMKFFDLLLDGRSTTYTHKWLRVYQPGTATDIHYDAPFMGRDAPESVITAWSPLGRVTLDMGPITLVPGSNRLENLTKGYAKEDATRGETKGFLTNDPMDVIDQYGLKFATTEFEPGDLLLFTKYILHGSVENTTGRYRLSTDTRYQRADEQHDEHYTLEQRAG